MDNNKEEIIKKVYTDPAGFGSIKDTLKLVNKIDPSITYDEVKYFIEKNTHRKII